MKENELRLGNWVRDGFNPNGIQLDLQRLNEWFDYSITDPRNKLEPIPLTEEWLVKFGFKSKGDDGYVTDWINNGLWICQSDSLFIEDKNNIELKYVHQLQNLYFALCGEELKLKE